MFLHSFLHNCKYISDFPQFKHLELCLIDLKDESIDLLSQVLQTKFPHLTSLNVKGNDITTGAAIRLVNAIAHCKHLTHLDLSFNNQIERYDILKHISSHLLENHLHEIKLIQSQSNVIIDDDSFLNMMIPFKHLRTFDLFEINDLVPFMKHIATLLPNISELRLLCAQANVVKYLNTLHQLKQLQLINVIDVSEFIALCNDAMLHHLLSFKLTFTDGITRSCLDKLTSMHNLHTLALSTIDNTLLKQLAVDVFPQMKQLHVLDLSQNDICGNCDIDVFCSGLKWLQMLNVFYIGNNCNLGIRSIVKITKALRMYCEFVWKVSFQGCVSEGDGGGKEWEEFWGECKLMRCVEKVNLSNNCMRDDYVEGFVKCVGDGYFKALRHLNLAFNSGITEMGIWSIIAVVDMLPRIEHIMLQECDYIDEQAYRELVGKGCRVVYLGNTNPGVGDINNINNNIDFQYGENAYHIPDINF